MFTQWQVSKIQVHTLCYPIQQPWYNIYIYKAHNLDVWFKRNVYFLFFSSVKIYNWIKTSLKVPTKTKHYMHHKNRAVLLECVKYNRLKETIWKWIVWSEVSCLLCAPCSLPRSVPGGADAVGPFWKDRFAVQHHSAANHTHLQTEVQRDPCLSLWRGIHTSLMSTTHFQHLWII